MSLAAGPVGEAEIMSFAIFILKFFNENQMKLTILAGWTVLRVNLKCAIVERTGTEYLLLLIKLC